MIQTGKTRVIALGVLASLLCLAAGLLTFVLISERVKGTLGAVYESDPEAARLIAEALLPLAKMMKEAGILSGVNARMMTIGHRTGSSDVVMEQISDLSQKKIDNSISNALGTIEPVLIVILSLVIGAILMSVMFPLLGIVSAI